MKEDISKAKDDVLRTILGRTWTDLLFRPSLVITVISSYILFALYYIYKVSTLKLISSDPDLLVCDTLMLITGSLVIVLTMGILIYGNMAHEKHEDELRKHIISYVSARFDNGEHELSDTLKDLTAIDSEINEHSEDDDLRNICCMMLILLIFSCLSLIPSMQFYKYIFVVLNYTLTIGICLIVVPSLSTFIPRHGKGTARFFNRLYESAEELGLGVMPMDLEFPQVPLKRYRMYTIVTLGVFGIYWLTKVFSSRNIHYMEQWYFEDCLFLSLKNDVECAVSQGPEHSTKIC